ncbi:MAG: diguanylate cyclase [Solirubrobacteraceae bacterium]|nr:diguanylate cyclase [Solirubrobacteraceae bacterium]
MEPATRSPLLRATLGLIGGVIGFCAAQVTFGFGGADLEVALRDWAPALVYVLVSGIVVARGILARETRLAWWVLATGLVLYTAGNLLWPFWVQKMDSPPIPSVCDVLWLSLYPASYVGLVKMAGVRGRGMPAGVWLDGLIAGLAVATTGCALIFPPLLDAATGSTVAVVTNLAYPVCDLLLVSLIAGVASLQGWRMSRVLWLLGAGFSTLAVGDTIYLLHVAAGSAESSRVANLFYMSGVALIALAAWQPRSAPPRPRIHGWSILLVPAIGTSGAVGLLAYDHFNGIGDVAVALALLTILTALARTVLTFRDVRGLAESRRQAVTDDLTSLPNRRLFVERSDTAIADASETRASFAMLIVDLDHFKELNDTLGHHAGDALLCDLGRRLLDELPDGGTLARLGGDEFGLVLSPCDEGAAIAIAARLRRALVDPFDIHGLSLSVSASVGIAMFPAHGNDTVGLMQHADIAMYEAKAAQSGHAVYEGTRNKHSRENLTLVSAFPNAVETGQLELHYQPKADMRTKHIVGVEALVRWRHPVRELIPPDVFVPLLDRAGLGRHLTRWVVETALAACARWRAAGDDLHVAVNATIADLLDASLPAEIAASLDRHGIPAGALVIEVTETSVLHDPGRVQATLTGLRALGVGVALDDFGTGYSSLTHLKAMPVTEVKIDRSFVENMGDDAADAAIVGSTIGLAHGLGLRVVAEGIEDEATWEHLADLGCELGQGYHYSRPLPEAHVDAFLRARDVIEAAMR